LIFKIVRKCGYNTWAYELCRSAYVHTLRDSNLLTVYYLQLFKQMTQTSHSRSCIKSFLYTELSVFYGVVCVCVTMTEHAYIVIEEALTGILVLK